MTSESDLSAGQPDWLPPDVDVSRPNAARVYDVYLGGAHNFQIDREFAKRAKDLLPEVISMARMNRAFLQRAVTELTRSGIDQFLDLGSGIPTVGNVHQVAQRINPDAKVVYVDNEAVAVAHSALILEDNPNADVVQADVREPDQVLTAEVTRQLLDFSRPVAVIMCTIVHFVSDEDDPDAVVRAYRDAFVPGSYLALSHATSYNRPDVEGVRAAYSQTANPVTARTKERIQRFFDGYEMLEPGLVFTPQWRPDHPADVGDDPENAGLYAGVGRRL
ncbi:MAG TPA: SAM-dependent methyltransferase [Pseudonocardiaceae bacterium]|nr:SAM-dependent methyltransferase [Pseudonocardiaceae bacterium]